MDVEVLHEVRPAAVTRVVPAVLVDVATETQIARIAVPSETTANRLRDP